MLFTVESAKQFLLSRLLTQAAHDGIALDDIEKRMFLFSETSGAADLEANDQFEKSYDSSTYELKITKLLRRSYAHDKRTEECKSEWKDVLKASSREDFYGLVMVDQAKIPRHAEGLLAFELEWLPFEILELAVMALGFLVVFRPSVLHLYLPDWVRWLAYPLFIWLFLYIGRVWGRMQAAKNSKKAQRAE